MQKSDLPVTKESSGTQQAVQDYLDTLLQDATLQAMTAPVVAPLEEVDDIVEDVVAPPAVEEQTEIAEPVVVAADAVQTDVADIAETTTIETSEAELETAETVAEQEPLTQEWINGRPAWAQSDFECLLFNVAGLTLAVPLIELGSVLTMDEELTPLFGQPDWFIGLLPSKVAGTVRVMDTAKKVMPEKYTEASRENLKYVILMKNSDWGLACHEVAEAIKLTPDEVRWRTNRGTRPWLAGTVINHMCAIMDVAALVDLVNKDELNIKAPQWSRQAAE